MPFVPQGISFNPTSGMNGSLSHTQANVAAGGNYPGPATVNPVGGPGGPGSPGGPHGPGGPSAPTGSAPPPHVPNPTGPGGPPPYNALQWVPYGGTYWLPPPGRGQECPTGGGAPVAPLVSPLASGTTCTPPLDGLGGGSPGTAANCMNVCQLNATVTGQLPPPPGKYGHPVERCIPCEQAAAHAGALAGVHS